MLADRSAAFLDQHRKGAPLLMPNPWDAGSAQILATLGFRALATTSSGFAASFGRADGAMSRSEVLAHAAAIVAAVDLPVNADFENGFADDPAGVAEGIRLAAATGLAGASIEDYSGNDDKAIYELAHAVDRIAAAAEAAHAGDHRLVLTARAENYLRGHVDLADTIDRLVAYQSAGADVVYAPGLITPTDIAAVVAAVEVPVNVLVLPGGPPVQQLADLGVSRISVAGAFAYAALGGLVTAASEFRDSGTLDFMHNTAVGRAAARAAFG